MNGIAQRTWMIGYPNSHAGEKIIDLQLPIGGKLANQFVIDTKCVRFRYKIILDLRGKFSEIQPKKVTFIRNRKTEKTELAASIFP